MLDVLTFLPDDIIIHRVETVKPCLASGYSCKVFSQSRSVHFVYHFSHVKKMSHFFPVNLGLFGLESPLTYLDIFLF